MATVRTNPEDRKREMNDHHNRVQSVFEVSDDIPDLLLERSKRRSFEEYQKLSPREKQQIMKDAFND